MRLSPLPGAGSPCPVCLSATSTRFADLYDDRYGYPDLFPLRECGGCGHLHVPAQFSPEALGELYTGYYPRGSFALASFQLEEERHGFSAWLGGDLGSAFRWVPRNVRVLDIGCGVGQALAYHKARACEAVGIDADANVQPVAARYGLDIRHGIFDGTQFEPETFDFVTLDQVAEHVVDPHALMTGVMRVLKPGGTVVITTPNPRSFGAWLHGRRWLNWHVPYHLQFYTSRSLGMVAASAGLKLMKSATVTASEWQYYQWRHRLQFPARGHKSLFWKNGSYGADVHCTGVKIIHRARQLGLHRWISRMLDLLGIGDNLVFILRKP